jgi:hypothetical protein
VPGVEPVPVPVPVPVPEGVPVPAPPAAPPAPAASAAPATLRLRIVNAINFWLFIWIPSAFSRKHPLEEANRRLAAVINVAIICLQRLIKQFVKTVSIDTSLASQSA